MGDLSEHFSRAEFRCRGFGHRGHAQHPTVVDRGLVELLELIRAETGLPLLVLSGHRCRWWNAQVAGAARSQHLLGTAADLLPGVVTTARADVLGAMGIGSRGVWAVHVDRRPRKALWSY